MSNMDQDTKDEEDFSISPRAEHLDCSRDDEMIQECHCCKNINRELLPPKVFYFFFFAANGALIPYLILFFKQLGLTPSQAGIVSGLKPFISFLFSPVWGFIADKTRRGKIVYIISLLAYIGGYTAYSFAPPSKNVCDVRNNISVIHHHPYMFHMHRKRDVILGVANKQATVIDIHTKKTTNSNSKRSRWSKRATLESNVDTMYTLFSNRHQIVNNSDSNFKNVGLIERIANKHSQIIDKNSQLHQDTTNKHSHINQSMAITQMSHYLYADLSSSLMGESLFHMPTSLFMSDSLGEYIPAAIDTTNDDVNSEFNNNNIMPPKGAEITWSGGVHFKNSPWTVCAAAKANIIDNINYDTNSSKPKETNIHKTFYYLLVVTISATLFSCPLITIVDTATIRKLKETHNTHKYGNQRMWGSFGWGIMAFVVGTVLSALPLCPGVNKEVNYIPAFYIFAAFLVIALFVGLKLQFDDNTTCSEENNHTLNERYLVSRSQRITDGLKLLKDPAYFSFVVTAFYIGVTMSIIKTFLFWHLKDIGGTQILFSLIAAVNCIAEVSVYYFSSMLIKRLTHIGVLYIALLCYALRLFYYGLLTSPWYVLAAEPLSGITTAASWAAMTSYVGSNANSESVTTMQGVLHGVHWGLGHGCGELIGGFMVSNLGASQTFNIFGALSILHLLLFWLVINYSNKKQDSYEELASEETENDFAKEDESKTEER